MANKERNKRSARKARAQERAEREGAQVDATPTSQTKTVATTQAATATKRVAKQTKAAKKPGFLGKSLSWFGDVRMEMRRVTWPTKGELKNYSFGVLAMLVIFGIVLWAVDLGVVAVLSAYAQLGA